MGLGIGCEGVKRRFDEVLGKKIDGGIEERFLRK